MGNCASCLGRRNGDYVDDDEEARLLFEDPNNIQYGSFGEQVQAHEDPVEVQREVEALQKVVARTSDNMVDIYEIAPQDKLHRLSTSYAHAAQEVRMAQYQSLLSRLSSNPDDEVVSDAKVDWVLLGEDDDVDTQQGVPPVKVEGGYALVGTFADAAAAMR